MSSPQDRRQHGCNREKKGLGSTRSPESMNSACSQTSSARESGDLRRAVSSVVDEQQPREGKSHNPRRKTHEESDALVVPVKSSKTRVTPVEKMEGRGAAKGKLGQGNVSHTQEWKDTQTRLLRVGKRAQTDKETKFVNLLSLVKVPLLREAYHRLKKHAAAGIDGMTWQEYGRDLDARLTDLQERIHRGSYHPPPVRRIHIPKPDGKTRPLGLPTVEDKIVQQAVRMVLEPIYEPVFQEFSYGFRAKRSAHDALDEVGYAIVKGRTNWVLDADIRNFFDSIDHEWMKKFVEHRIGDTRLVRLLMKWLKAGVMESGTWSEVSEGTPQGGVISPLLANIFLHYTLDLWVGQWRKRNARKQVFIVRYADDFVMTFEDEKDAHDMQTALDERLKRFGLQLHEDKTRLIRFGRFAKERSEALGLKTETFDFLGFTHSCGVHRYNGWFELQRRTSRKKRQRKLAELSKQLRLRRHENPRTTHAWLLSVVRGYDAYYAVPTNEGSLRGFRKCLRDAWTRQLERRSDRGRLSVQQCIRFEKRFPFPMVHVRHPWPEMRFRPR